MNYEPCNLTDTWSHARGKRTLQVFNYRRQWVLSLLQCDYRSALLLPFEYRQAQQLGELTERSHSIVITRQPSG